MTVRVPRAVAVAILIATAAACGRTASSPPAIVLNTSTPGAAVVDVTGLPGDVADALDGERTP